MKHNTFVLANALGATFGALSVGCILVILVAPDLYAVIENLWLHGRNLSVLGPVRLELMNATTGVLTFAGFGWVVGYVYGWFLEFFSKRK